MNINLDNYEQWLLLYVDKELSAAERSSVEEFLVQYPYLQQELGALQQATLPVENILFDTKSNLLKPVVSEEAIEQMLLQLDNELPAAEKNTLQKNIAASKDLQTEWASLQKTQLNKADIIPFPDKQLLYKKEKGRVVGMAFIRWTAAAVVVGLGFWIATNFGNNGGTQDDLASNGQDSSFPVTNGTNNNNIAVTDPSATNATQNDATVKGQQNIENISVKNNDVAVTNRDDSRTTNKQVVVNKINAAQQVQKSNNPDIAVNNKQKAVQQNDNNIVPLNNNVLPSSNDIAALPNKTSNNTIDLNTQVSGPKKEIIDVNTRANQNAYAQTAAYTFDENNNSVLMMEEEDITRSKAGIFLKKVKRNIERRANIKPGKSLKIAGFELAVK